MAASYYPPPPPPTHYPSSSSAYYPPPPPPPPGVSPPPALPPYTYSYNQPYPYDLQYAAPAYDLQYAPQPPSNELRTLFVAGLPGDTKSREVYHLFRDFPGYISSHIRYSHKSSQAYAFAIFADQQSAIAAMNAVNGMIFDLEKDSALHVDLAKSNSRGKRTRADDVMAYSSDKKGRKSAAYERGISDSGAGSNIHMPGMGNSAHTLNGYPSTQSHVNFDHLSDATSSKGSSVCVPQDNPPCPTLFVANLGATCTEQELTQVFSRCEGFIKLKFQKRSGLPVAFVDFEDVKSSIGALHLLQGTVLYSSFGEGIRLEFARSRMGLRRREKRS